METKKPWKQPHYLISEYGDLLNLRPLLGRERSKDTTYSEVEIVTDNTSVERLHFKMKKRKHAYFLFDPDTAHYTNAIAIFNALKRRIHS